MESTPSTDATATAATAPPVRTITKKVYTGFPKGANRKVYKALKTKKARQAYLLRYRRRHSIKPKEVTITLHSSKTYHPWLPDKPVNAPEKPKRKGRTCWPKGLDMKVYSAKKPGKEREEYLALVKKQHGLKPKPASHKLVPQNFAWPKGMSYDEFLAKKPGKDRMAYLATYIRKNGIELEEKPAPPHPPIGRQPEPLAHPRCGCSSPEACASCNRCMELHCVCGLTGRRRRALCQESRACSCSLTDPTTRCKLCHGCRQPHGFSHCRCVLHQRLLWIKGHPDLGMELTEDEEKNVCNCFVLAHRHGGASATKEKEAKARKEIERVRRIKRATGYPSSDNIYRSNKVTAFLGDEGLETDLDDGVDDGPGSEVLPPSSESVLPRIVTRRMLDSEYNPASYHPLYRADGCSLLETIEPRGGPVSRRGTAAFKSGAIQDEICRGLENITYELERNATMPPDDMVDFLVYMASIKSSNIRELIGTFEDSAAVAASIVIEEYMAQLVEDSVVQRQAPCPPTESTVQAFTRELLVGFNWRLFQQQHPYSSSEAMDRVAALMDKERMLKNKVEALILREFVSIQPRHFDAKVYGNALSRWINSAIVIPLHVLTGETGLPSSTTSTRGQPNVTAQSAHDKHQGDKIGAAQSIAQIRLSVKANTVHGDPSYKLHFGTTLHDGHRVETTVGGLDSKFKANTTISQLSKVVERQEQRSKGLLKDPPPAPGPPPVLRPTPRLDPNNRSDDIVPVVWEHFNEYAQRKWKASCDAYYNATIPGWSTPEHEVAAKRQATESPLRDVKKRKISSPQ